MDNTFLEPSFSNSCFIISLSGRLYLEHYILLRTSSLVNLFQGIGSLDSLSLLTVLVCSIPKNLQQTKLPLVALH